MTDQKIQVLLNLGPHHIQLDPTQRQHLLKVCPGAEIIVKEDNSSLEQFDGRAVNVLVTEDVPRNLDAWPRLRFVQSLASGIDYLHDHPIWTTNLIVCNASGTHSVPIAQYITCMLLMMAHRVPDLLRFKTTRQWPDRKALSGYVVRGKTAGIVGYGSIGREAARQLSALGLRIVCLKREPANRRDEGFNPWPGTGDPEGAIPDRWFAPGQLRHMLPLCDVLIVTAPITPSTVGLIGTSELQLLKPNALMIIASRGGIVDENALADALRGGHLAAAAVDSFIQEPLPPDHPFFEIPNLILTSHMSGVYEPYWPQGFQLFAENLTRFSHGQPLLNQASGQLGY